MCETCDSLAAVLGCPNGLL